jgi:hypothetical protein
MPWPARPEALQFVYGTGITKLPLAIAQPVDPEIKERYCTVIGHQSARFGPGFELDVSRGYYTADSISSDALTAACKASGALSVEAVIRESRDDFTDPLSVRLAGCRAADGREMWGLYRVESHLVIRLRLGTDTASARVYPLLTREFKIGPDRPFHFCFTVDESVLRIYIDGVLQGETALEASGLGAWENGTLQLGDGAPMGDKKWTGHLDHVAMYSRSLTEGEVSANFDARRAGISAHKVIDRLRVQATLEAVTPLRGPVDQAYNRILTSRTYRVVKVERGIYQPQYMVVLHDAALNYTPVPNLPEKLGENFLLEVEAASLHPELNVVQIHNESPLPKLPLYFEVTPPTRIQP